MYPKHHPLSQSLLDDPAFSQDPTLHPLHSPAPSPSSTWAIRNASATTIPNFDPLSVPPGHPMLKQDLQATIPARRPPLPPIAVTTYMPGADYDRDAPSLPLQPPNTPQADGPVFAIRHMQPHQTLRSDDQLREPTITFPFKPTEPSNSIPATLPSQNMSPGESSSSSDSSPSTTPPSSANSHILPGKSDVAVAEQKEEKRKRTFSFFRRKPAGPPPPPPMASKLTKAPKPPSPTKAKSPITEAEQALAPEVPRPGQTRSTTMPEMHKSDTQPLPLPRSASAPSDLYPPKPMQVRSLDRIDELDETNPFGSHVHHGGPYEAISRLIEGKQKHPDLSGGPDIPHMAGHRKGSHQVSASLTIPRSTPLSLNIKPGQVIPRDYAYGANPYPGRNANYLGSQQPPPVNFVRNVHGAASDPGRGQNPGPSYHNAFLQPFPSNDTSVSSSNAQGINRGRTSQQQPQPQSSPYPPQSRLPPQRPPQPPQITPLRKSSPPRQAQPPPQQTVTFPHPPSQHTDRVEFDPYASYSPTARPRALDDPSLPPLSIPIPQQMISAPQKPQQTAIPAVKSVPLHVSPPPEQLLPSYETSEPQFVSNQYIRDVDAKHPPSTSNTLPLPNSGQQRQASPVPDGSSLERDVKGGINGAASVESVASQQASNSTPSSGRSSLEDKQPEGSRNGHTHEALAATQPTTQPITPPNMPFMEANVGPQSLTPPIEFAMAHAARGVPGVPASSASSVRTGVSRGNRGPPPRVSHLPKKLVMPTPLQQQSNQGGFAGHSYQPSQSNIPPQRYHSQQPRYAPPTPHYPDPQYAAPMSPPQEYPSQQPGSGIPSRSSGERQVPQSLDENAYPREYSPRPGPPQGHPPDPDQGGPPVIPEQYRQQVYFQNSQPMPPMANQHGGRQPPFPPDGYNPRGVPPSRSLSPRAQEIQMTTDRKVLRKRSKVGSSESIAGPELYQPADGAKEMNAKEKAKMDKMEREREKFEAKERERVIKEREKNEARERKEREKQIKERERALKGKIQVKEVEAKAGQKIPKRVLSKRRNDM